MPLTNTDTIIESWVSSTNIFVIFYSIKIMNFFNSKPDPKELQRENNRVVRRANRDLEKDRKDMERRERELEAEIKKMAKQGNKEACTVLAKQLVQLRKHKTKSVGMSAKMSSVAAQNSHMYSMGRMSEAMGQTVTAMKTMEKMLPVEKVARNMREFQMANEKMGLTEEMMNEALDGIFDEPGDSEQQDAIVNQVLDEIGIEMNDTLSSIPKLPTSVGAQPAAKTSDVDIEQMLAQLRS